jgi:hypothetical protein
VPKLDPIPVYRDSEVCCELVPNEALLPAEGSVALDLELGVKWTIR